MRQRMTNAERLVNELRYWGWPLFFKSLGEKAMLICDEDLLPPIREITGPLKCRTMAPSAVEDSDRFRTAIQQSHTLVVFTRHNEYALTAFLRRVVPSRRTFSAQYDLAPVSTKIPVRLPTTPVNAPLPSPLLKPVVLVSTPGADGEYLAELMDMAGMPRPTEFLAKPFIEILAQGDGFSPLRFYRSLQRKAAADGSLAIHLQTDVIDAMTANNAISTRRLRWALEQSGAKVIALTRQDTLFQAGLLGLFHGRPFRSVWTIPAGRRKGFPGTIRSSFDDTHQCLMDLERMEADMAALLNGFDQMVTLTTEDLITDPEAGLERIGTLLGLTPDKDIEVPDYVEGYTSLNKLPDRIRDFRRQLIDRAGLQLAPH